MNQTIKRHNFTRDVSSLCSRLYSLQLKRSVVASFHTNVQCKNMQLDAKSKPNSKLLPVELLRKEALKVANSMSIRSRCPWTEEEDEKLLKLVKEKGKSWTSLSKEFVNRPPAAILCRYELLTDRFARGPWSENELEALRKLGDGRSFEEITEWNDIQAQLPRRRPVFLIKQTYKHSLDPRIKHGRWTEEESNMLKDLMLRYGDEGMNRVASFMGTRTPRQCLERWRWQMADMKKGRFSVEEDMLITEAVKKYGENFAVICKVTGIDRTPRHVSQHYHGFLAPGIDRSPWGREEEEQVYKVCTENNRDMLKTKGILKSNRSVRDMWNHFIKIERTKIASATKNNATKIKEE